MLKGMAMGKILVAYFSASGTTARVARKIAQATGADVYEIASQSTYSAADLNWNDNSSRTSLERLDDGMRPELACPLPDMAAYDTVFVGFPVWWYVEPRIVDTFVEGVDLAGKTVIPFATSGGSGIAGAEERMRGLRPDAIWKQGGLLNGGDVAVWAKNQL